MGITMVLEGMGSVAAGTAGDIEVALRLQMKSPPRREGRRVWCWNICIPPAPVQTAYSFETVLTLKSVNARMLSKPDYGAMTYRKYEGCKKIARDGIPVLAMAKLPPSTKHNGQHSRIVNEHDGPEHGVRLNAVEKTF